MREKEDVPAGYRRELVKDGDVELIALPAAWDAARHALDSAGTLFDYAAGRPDAQPLAGRGVAYHIGAPGSYTNERWVVRHYRRGGLVARFVQDRYVHSSPTRPMRELSASV